MAYDAALLSGIPVVWLLTDLPDELPGVWRRQEEGAGLYIDCRNSPLGEKPKTISSLQDEERAMSFTWAPRVAMSQEEIDSFLRQKLVARLTSIRPDGYPHTTPLWYVWDGEVLWFELGAGERPRQHIRNLRRNPKLCVIIDRDARPEQGGVFDAQGVVIRGTVELSTDETLQEDVARKVLRKYLGDEGDQYVDVMLQDGKPGKNRVIAKVRPESIFAWDFRKLQGPGG